MGCKESKVHDPMGFEKETVATSSISKGAGSDSTHSLSASTREGSPTGCTPASTPATSPAGSRQASKAESTVSIPDGARLVLDRYIINAGKKSVLGEGTSSVCYLGSDTVTGQQVAIKEYKKSHKKAVDLKKFKRQVDVLLELQKPFGRPADESLWSEELAQVKPSDLFVAILDYSKDKNGEPGKSPEDGSMFVVTELAECTLKNFLKQRNERDSPLSPDQVRKIAKEIVLAVAGLHAKGLIHMDLKPENMMMCGGRWKLIDMDGCVRAGTTVSENDSSVSFSPCYCAPEFAKFVIKGGSIVASPGLDAWSVGMTIAELVNLCPILRGFYNEISAGYSRRDGSTRFLKWLSNLSSVPMPRRILSADADYLGLVNSCMLVCDKSKRKTLAQCLSAPYLQSQVSQTVGQRR